MTPRIWVRFYALTGDERQLDYLDKEFWAAFDFLYSPEHKLVLLKEDGQFFGVQRAGHDPQPFGPAKTVAYGTGAYLMAGANVCQIAVGKQFDERSMFAEARDSLSCRKSRRDVRLATIIASCRV